MIVDAIVTSIMSVVCFLSAWIYCRRHDEAAQLRDEVDDLMEKLRTAVEERDGWQETAESTRKLLRAVTERADRFAAMNQGLAEDLAALKAYNPEEIEERLKKIRELRADEERKKAEKRRDELMVQIAAAQMLSAQNSLGFGAFSSPASCGYGSPMSMFGR